MLHQIAPQFITTGQIKIVHRNFSFLGAESDWAAQAAECAAEQNSFWEYGTYLFTHQAKRNTGAFSRENLKRFATQLSLNANDFGVCLDSGRHETRVKQETEAGRARGVKATPTFFFNGRLVEGVLTAEQFATQVQLTQAK